MKFDKVNRRFFLQGAGGLLVTLPALPSLMGKAFAQSNTTPRNKRFIYISSRNQFNPRWMFNYNESNWTTAQGYRYQAITDVNAMCPILGSNFQRFAGQLSFIKGLNLGFLDHNWTCLLGNIAGCHVENCLAMPSEKTIDVVMAEHLGRTHSAILKVADSSMASQCSDGTHRTQGGGLPVTLNSNPYLIFQNYFTNLPQQPAPGNTLMGTRRKLVDLILNDSRALLSQTFLSTADRNAINEHIDYMNDLETRYAGSTPMPQLACTPGSNTYVNQNVPLWNGAAYSVAELQRRHRELAILIAEGVKCNIFPLANFAVTQAVYNNSVYSHIQAPTSYHDAAHDNNITILTGLNRWILQNIFQEILIRLDVEETPGTTYLDNSIVAFTPEASEAHLQNNMPLILAGRGGGTIESGRFWDFADTSYRLGEGFYNPSLDLNGQYYLSVPYNRYWNGILQAWGMSPIQYEQPGRPGYGNHAHFYTNPGWGSFFAQYISQNRTSYFRDIGRPLPGLFKIPA